MSHPKLFSGPSKMIFLSEPLVTEAKQGRARLPSHLEGLCKKKPKTKQTDNPNSRLPSLMQLSLYLSSKNTFLGRKLIENTLKPSLFFKNVFHLRAAPLMKKVGGRHEHPLGHDCGVFSTTVPPQRQCFIPPLVNWMMNTSPAVAINLFLQSAADLRDISAGPHFKSALALARQAGRAHRHTHTHKQAESRLCCFPDRLSRPFSVPAPHPTETLAADIRQNIVCMQKHSGAPLCGLHALRVTSDPQQSHL